MADEVIATEELIKEWLFEKKKAEVVFAVENGEEVGFALFFTTFPPSLAALESISKIYMFFQSAEERAMGRHY
ncbi:hypothetical protein SDC9_131711 [bioreactor metagenome]|uniref:Uncharacterized protein n=1 Tax=bioreactor metagenome TaxID=1076179 RepID=A0A645D6E3_9ZZZZ